MKGNIARLSVFDTDIGKRCVEVSPDNRLADWSIFEPALEDYRTRPPKILRWEHLLNVFDHVL